MMPKGEELRISSTVAVQGSTTEKTFCSRMRRAISWEYWAPKSRTTIDWVSTDECLKSEGKCKGEGRFWLLASGFRLLAFGSNRFAVCEMGTSGAEAHFFWPVTARLKPCPSQNRALAKPLPKTVVFPRPCASQKNALARKRAL